MAKTGECCCGITILPQTTYRITTTYSDGSTSSRTQKTNNTCMQGVLEAMVFIVISFVSPLDIFYILFLYVSALCGVCSDFKIQRQIQAKRQKERAKRMSSSLSDMISQNYSKTNTLKTISPYTSSSTNFNSNQSTSRSYNNQNLANLNQPYVIPQPCNTNTIAVQPNGYNSQQSMYNSMSDARFVSQYPQPPVKPIRKK